MTCVPVWFWIISSGSRTRTGVLAVVRAKFLRRSLINSHHVEECAACPNAYATVSIGLNQIHVVSCYPINLVLAAHDVIRKRTRRKSTAFCGDWLVTFYKTCLFSSVTDEPDLPTRVFSIRHETTCFYHFVSGRLAKVMYP